MSRALPVPVRRAVFRRWRRGQAAAAIALALGLRPNTVRRLLRRFERRGPAGVAPSYDRCGPKAAAAPAELVQAALALRREHPRWGAGLIRVLLRRGRPRGPLPSERTLRRWLHRAGLGPAPSGRKPRAGPRRAGRPHETWQIDAAERVRLRDGREVSWLRIADECTGAALGAAVFPPAALGGG